MPDYKNMYSKLLVAVSDSIEVLQKAMQEAEEIYISEEENNFERYLPLCGTGKEKDSPLQKEDRLTI